MDESGHDQLVRSWSRALHATGESDPPDPAIDQLLHWLVYDLAQELTTPHFDPDAGARAGAALATAGPAAHDVVAASAPILWSLVGESADAEAIQRMSVLLAKFGEGFGARRQMLFTAHDYSDEAARRSDERFRVVFDNAAVAIAIGDTNGILLDANQVLADMIGVPADKLRGISVYEFAHPEDRERIRRLVYERLVPHRRGTVKLDQQIGRADGSYGWASFSITFVEGSEGHPNYLLAMGEDVTEQHRMREELHRQARHDPLTGLPNRRHLLERLDATIRNAGAEDHIGLCFVDLDRFKHVNDRYGHGTGDKVLTTVANRLQNSVQGFDCLVARIGGDEFVALVPPPVDDDRMALVAERLLGALADPVGTGGHQLQISASIGAVVTTVEGGQAEALLDAADTGLYHAKNNGKAQWVLHTLGTEPGAGLERIRRDTDEEGTAER
ncbi:diguanylate cyclase domain-containing protein [Nocardia sp. NBC_00416]|uniref:diguanylate cyclase domain-containing protein n=1 Tax=Nocardia sp. NBC_00416 TaxID=2975991 RepID=UPI002E1C0738